MKHSNLVLAMVSCLVLVACATQRYGRMQSLTPTEAQYLDCRGLQIEIEKVQAFVRDLTETDAKVTGKDVLGFLGDFGIGNSMERKDALASANNRLDQLNALKKEKNCT